MRRRFHPQVMKIPWRRKWQPTPVFLSGKSYGQRSLVGYSPWGCKEPDMAKVTACTESPELENFYDLPMFRVLDGEYCENYK